VIQHFEEALESAIALAFFIPLLIGTGGNSGTQITSTLVRAMALGEVHLRDVGRVLRKEMTTSLMIAVTLGIAGYSRLDDGDWAGITLIVSLTLVCITLWSAIVSSVIPMVLKRCGIDPAVVSAPFIATLIDGTGLIIYFKIAQYTLGLGDVIPCRVALPLPGLPILGPWRSAAGNQIAPSALTACPNASIAGQHPQPSPIPPDGGLSALTAHKQHPDRPAFRRAMVSCPAPLGSDNERPAPIQRPRRPALQTRIARRGGDR
jgi:cation transporter-like permease